MLNLKRYSRPEGAASPVEGIQIRNQPITLHKDRHWPLGDTHGKSTETESGFAIIWPAPIASSPLSLWFTVPLWEGSPSGTDLSKIVPCFPTWSSSEGPLAFKIKPRSLARWWKAPFQPPPWRSWTNRHWPFHGSGPLLQQFPEPGLSLAMTGSQPWLQTQIICRN